MKVTLEDGILTFEPDSQTRFSRPASEEDLARFPELFTDQAIDYDVMDLEDLRALATQRGVPFSPRAKAETIAKKLRAADESDA